MKDVTTLFHLMTEKQALFLLQVEMVVSKASKKPPDLLIMLSYGLFIESTTVQDPTLIPGSLGRGRTHKQMANIGPYRGGQVPNAVCDHSLVDLCSHIQPHGQDVPLMHSSQDTKSRQRTSSFPEGHLVEPIFKVEDGPEMIPMLSPRRSSFTGRGIHVPQDT